MPSFRNAANVIRLAIAAALVFPPAAIAANDDALGAGQSLAVETVDQFQRNGGVYPGYRRNHAKGVCIAGYFNSSGNAARYSTALVFAPGARTPVIGRLSIPGTNPYAWDGSTPIRGMALVMTAADGQQWRTAMNAVPAFPVATPAANLEFLEAQQPDPATGKPDPKQLAAFFATHPRADAFRKWDRSTQPSASFAGERYNSLDAFWLVDAMGNRHAVRWSMVPDTGVSDKQAPTNDPDYLAADLRTRLAGGPLHWRLVITFANPGDAIDDASLPWPSADHRAIDAGTLVIDASQPQADGPCRDINFNPLVLPTGIEPSDDPLLKARAEAYAESHRRRVGEETSTGSAAPASASTSQ